MKIEILISTMKRENIDFLSNMNIKSDVVVGNQSDKFSTEEFVFNGNKCKFITTNTKGLSRNRNITLDNATGDICLIADDDLTYEDDYAEKIINAFNENPSADLIIFNLKEKPIIRYLIKKKFKVKSLNYMRFGSVRIAFKLNSIREKGIKFDNNFGSGSIVPFGEDTIFLHDCLKAKLKIYAIPEYLLSLNNDRPSTWFNGYTEEYLINKGKLFRRINKKFLFLLCFQDAFRHHRKYGYSFFKTLSLERLGGKNETD